LELGNVDANPFNEAARVHRGAERGCGVAVHSGFWNSGSDVALFETFSQELDTLGYIEPGRR
jgi:hypothetical protein